jgi:ribosomal protein L17
MAEPKIEIMEYNRLNPAEKKIVDDFADNFRKAVVGKNTLASTEEWLATVREGAAREIKENRNYAKLFEEILGAVNNKQGFVGRISKINERKR